MIRRFHLVEFPQKDAKVFLASKGILPKTDPTIRKDGVQARSEVTASEEETANWSSSVTQNQRQIFTIHH